MGHDPVLFVLLTGLVFFAWGEIYSLFPSTCADTFGTKYATTNAGLLYTAKGTAALIVPFTSIVQTTTGSWHAVFVAAAALNIIAGLMALFLLKPMRASFVSKAKAPGIAPVQAPGDRREPPLNARQMRGWSALVCLSVASDRSQPR